MIDDNAYPSRTRVDAANREGGFFHGERAGQGTGNPSAAGGPDQEPAAAEKSDETRQWECHGARIYHVAGPITAPLLAEITAHANRTGVPIHQAEVHVSRHEVRGLAGALAQIMETTDHPVLHDVYFSWDIE